MKIQFHRIDTNVVVGLLVREFCCSGTDVSAKVLAMYAGTRTPSMEPQWLAAGLSQQQHMWYAALDGEASIFVTHPGSTSEEGDMRPGYWHGNGVMPALKQKHGLLGGIYVIPDEHPIGYTHLYCPECRFDEVIHEENWIFLRKETGYLALWCSEKMEAHNGMNFNCEQRAYSKNAAYLCVCGGQKSDASFAAFIKRAKETSPSYDKESKTLTAQSFELSYVACKDVTQFL